VLLIQQLHILDENLITRRYSEKLFFTILIYNDNIHALILNMSYHRAAEQGHDSTQYNLGVCYEYGTGVEKDEQKAVELYKKAAEQGDAGAQCNLANGYYNGTGVEKDEQK